MSLKLAGADGSLAWMAHLLSTSVILEDDIIQMVVTSVVMNDAPLVVSQKSLRSRPTHI
jgi:hypothetical protein